MVKNKTKINCIVIEDEIASQKVLEHFISDTEILSLTACFSNPKEAFKYLQLTDGIDLIFLDINMPEQHGLDFYKSLNPRPPVIFTTAYPQYAVEGFELNAIDYLLKPIPYDRFLKAIKKVRNIQSSSSKPEQSFISLKENKVIYKVEIDSIIYLEAKGDYVKVTTSKQTITTHSTFTHFIQQLPTSFLRIHKSFCINIGFITKLSGNRIEVAGYNLPIGQTYKIKVLQSLNI